MATTITKGSTLPATGCTRQNIYDMLENSTLANISNAELAGGINPQKIDFSLAGINTAITYTGSGVPKRSIILTAAGATVPVSGGAAQNQTDGTNVSYWSLDFDKDTDEKAFWSFTMPDSYDDGNVTVTVYWTTTDTTASSEVQFEVSFSQLTESDAIDGAMGTATEIDDAIPASGFASGDVLITSATTVTGANFCDAGDFVICKLIRDIDGPTGTDINADVKVLAVKIEWGKDQDTD